MHQQAFWGHRTCGLVCNSQASVLEGPYLLLGLQHAAMQLGIFRRPTLESTCKLTQFWEGWSRTIVVEHRFWVSKAPLAPQPWRRYDQLHSTVSFPASFDLPSSVPQTGSSH